MALPTISLDDRSFEQLFVFMRKQIATDQWSDHNYSDAGIALLDLLCWVGEMVLYRANLVPDSHIVKFADFILDPPEPVTRQLTLTATINPLRLVDLVVPAGTRFATDFANATATTPARRFVFETIDPATFRRPTAPQDAVQERTVTARELLVVQNEPLGFSDGTANQTFQLRPVRSDLGLPADALAPILLDFVHRSATYEPNPQITVAGAPWKELKQFLLTGESWIDPIAPTPKNHYMVDADTGAIRFGDGTFGSIPPAGDPIVCTRYQLLQGPDALKEDPPLVHQLDPVPGLMAGEAVTFSSGPAEGGNFFFRPEERIREGLKRFRRPFRLVTAADFEQVMLIDFNEVLQLSEVKKRVVRAVALMNWRPTVTSQVAPGHVTIAVLALDPVPTAVEDLETALIDPLTSIAGKNALISLTPDFVDRIVRFLDKRRLITTRVHIEPLTVEPVSVALQVAVARNRDLVAMKDLITERVTRFLGIVRGGLDGQGWPTGGDVYRSRIFRMVEDIDGVDHVESLALSPANADGDVTISPLSVPALSSLAVLVSYI